MAGFLWIKGSRRHRPRMARGWFTPIHALRLVLLLHKLLVVLLPLNSILC